MSIANYMVEYGPIKLLKYLKNKWIKIVHLLKKTRSGALLDRNHFSIAGSPYPQPRAHGESAAFEETLDHIQPEILDNPRMWVPAVFGSLLQLECDDIRKIKLLKTRMTTKDIVLNTSLNGSSAVGVGAGIACCVAGAGASFAGPVGPVVGIPLLTLGAVTITISLATSASTNASTIIKATKLCKNKKKITEKEACIEQQTEQQVQTEESIV